MALAPWTKATNYASYKPDTKPLLIEDDLFLHSDYPIAELGRLRYQHVRVVNTLQIITRIDKRQSRGSLAKRSGKPCGNCVLRALEKMNAVRTGRIIDK